MTMRSTTVATLRVSATGGGYDDPSFTKMCR